MLNSKDTNDFVVNLKGDEIRIGDTVRCDDDGFIGKVIMLRPTHSLIDPSFEFHPPHDVGILIIGKKKEERWDLFKYCHLVKKVTS